MDHHHRSALRRAVVSIALALAVLSAGWLPAEAQTPETEPDGPPFSMPLAEPPGPSTWVYEQHYGNTTAAYNYGSVWYVSGQGMHFGADFEAPCGTPVLAIADGIVRFEDAEGFGAGPHSLVIDHPGTGYSSLYGHLLEYTNLGRGTLVERGQQIALTGDPDGSCESRPHLHLEIRSQDYQQTFNPVNFFDINWHMLASIGPYQSGFQQDLDAPRRWMRLEDQPDISFGGNWLNNYVHPWPPKLELRAPVNPPAPRELPPLADAVRVTRSVVSRDVWNVGAWWRPDDPEAVYLIDAVPGEDAGVFRQPVSGGQRAYVEVAPPTLSSPDGSVTVRRLGNGTFDITRLADNTTFNVATGGVYPAVSPDGRRLLWEVVYGEILPGTVDPGIEFWVSNIDGSVQRRVFTQSGGYSMWLDSHRLLIFKRPPYTATTQLFILDIDDPAVTPQLLGTYRYLRGLEVAPGGAWIAYWLPFQEDPASSGVYVQRTEIGSSPVRLPFFGAYQWRDARSLFTLSFDMAQDVHTLGVIDVGELRLRTLTDPATTPIRVANGDWHVSPDGTRIVFVDPTDYDLYMLTIEQ